MKLLLDASAPRRLAASFPATFAAHTVRQTGWAGTVNGILLTLAAQDGFDAGSSPRMRGTLRVTTDADSYPRFIPAHAGNTKNLPANQSSASVHPRACGEHFPRRRRAWPSNGSSPRMRGTLGCGYSLVLVRRFIPAHAGNTWRRRGRGGRGTVHPRACGEHPGRRPGRGPGSGSSPRMRGTRDLLLAFEAKRRFIPAHAGNTATREMNARRVTVHPRACGEHTVLWRKIERLAGSSPRMRGTQVGYHDLPRSSRFIPAHAGNTNRSALRSHGPPVHPRACGEHTHSCA